jgi:hypothetical protein
MKAYLDFNTYYHKMPNWYNMGNLSLLIFESTEHPLDRYALRVLQVGGRTALNKTFRIHR